jgi:hypothetical protein
MMMDFVYHFNMAVWSKMYDSAVILEQQHQSSRAGVASLWPAARAIFGWFVAASGGHRRRATL